MIGAARLQRVASRQRSDSLLYFQAGVVRGSSRTTESPDNGQSGGPAAAGDLQVFVLELDDIAVGYAAGAGHGD